MKNKSSMQSNHRLLYVEDEIETRKNIIDYIQRFYNMEIIEADDGEEGWDKYQEYKPDILITDLSMNNLSGLELIEMIREVDKEIKIIIITAHGEQEKLLRAIKLNLIEYYIKPINRTALKKCLSQAMEQLKIDNDNLVVNFNKTTYYDVKTNTLSVDNKIVKLTQSEIKLLNFLIINKNKAIESLLIFNELWDFEREFKAESVRTLIKKLRKRLPENSIDNIYGGLYRLNV